MRDRHRQEINLPLDIFEMHRRNGNKPCNPLSKSRFLYLCHNSTPLKSSVMTINYIKAPPPLSKGTVNDVRTLPFFLENSFVSSMSVFVRSSDVSRENRIQVTSDLKLMNKDGWMPGCSHVDSRNDCGKLTKI